MQQHKGVTNIAQIGQEFAPEQTTSMHGAFTLQSASYTGIKPFTVLVAEH